MLPAYCQHKQNGKRLPGIRVLGAVTIENGIAYIGASDSTFRAIDIHTGKVIWPIFLCLLPHSASSVRKLHLFCMIAVISSLCLSLYLLKI